MILTTHIRRLAPLAVAMLAAMIAPAAHAGLLAPKTIDAGTGKDSGEVGAAIGNHRAWAAFVQETGGVKRLYAEAAHNGRWAHPFLADRGNEVQLAGLAGSGRGRAVLVFTEKVGGKEVLFGRRLANGAGGPVDRISAAGEDVRSDPLNAHGARGNGVVMDDAGAAAVCYRDAVSQKPMLATLAAGASQWVEHPVASDCLDLVIDARGDVVSVGTDGQKLFASKIVNGQSSTETIGNAMDEPSVAISPSGLAIALVRDNNFHVVAFRKRDVTSNSPWESLGRVDSDTVFDNGDSPEEPRATLDANGNGVIVWHSNSMNDAKTAYNIIRTGQPATAKFLSKEATDSFPYATTIATGMPAVGFELPGGKTGLFTFRAGVPSAPLTLAPAIAPTVLNSAAGLVGDGKGNLVVLLFAGQNPIRTVAVFGDFGRPGLKPRAPHKVHARKRVTLTSGATDTFADPRPNQVRWTLPRGVRALAGTHGLKLRVRFARKGRYTIRLTVTDLGGNTHTATLRVKVRR